MQTSKRIASDFTLLAQRFEDYAKRTNKPKHMATNLAASHVQAGRLLYEAIAADLFPRERREVNGGWWDASAGRYPCWPPTPPASIGEATDDQCAMGWVLAVGSWLAKKFPSRFRPDAAKWYWKQSARDDDGRPVDADGHPLKWVWRHKKTGELLPEGTTLTDIAAMDRSEDYTGGLDGDAASVHERHDDADWLEHNRIQAEVDAAACRVLAELLEQVEASPAPPAEPITLDDTRLTYDGSTRTITEDQAVLVRALIEARGRFISLADLKEPPHHLGRPDRIKNKLPDEIKAIIESQTGRGSRLTCWD